MVGGSLLGCTLFDYFLGGLGGGTADLVSGTLGLGGTWFFDGGLCGFWGLFFSDIMRGILLKCYELYLLLAKHFGH